MAFDPGPDLRSNRIPPRFMKCIEAGNNAGYSHRRLAGDYPDHYEPRPYHNETRTNTIKYQPIDTRNIR